MADTAALGKLAPQRRPFPDVDGLRQRLLEDCAERLRVHRLREVVESTLFHGGDGVLDRAVTGEHDHGCGRQLLVNGPEEFDPTESVQEQVGNDHARLERGCPFERLARIRRRFDLIPPSHHSRREIFEQGRIVVGNQDPLFHGPHLPCRERFCHVQDLTRGPEVRATKQTLRNAALDWRYRYFSSRYGLWDLARQENARRPLGKTFPVGSPKRRLALHRSTWKAHTPYVCRRGTSIAPASLTRGQTS